MQLRQGYLSGLILSLAIFIFWVFPVLAADAPKITKDALKEKIDTLEVIIIDVREKKDWNASQFKIKGAIREDATAFNSWANKYPQNKTLITYCA